MRVSFITCLVAVVLLIVAIVLIAKAETPMLLTIVCIIAGLGFGATGYIYRGFAAWYGVHESHWRNPRSNPLGGTSQASWPTDGSERRIR